MIKDASIVLTHVDSDFYVEFGTVGWFVRVEDEDTLYSDSIVEGVMLFATPNEAFDWGIKSYKITLNND
jgi:hypothetical protein